MLISPITFSQSAIVSAPPVEPPDPGDTGEENRLSLGAIGRFAILTCMDARFDPARLAGDAHVVRNAGGHASDDAIRSLVLSHKLLGTRAWLVIHHSNCGMALFSDQFIGALLSSGPAPTSASQLTLGGQGDSVAQDVRRIRQHPLVPSEIPIYGYIFEADSGRLVEVPEATRLGRPKVAV